MSNFQVKKKMFEVVKPTHGKVQGRFGERNKAIPCRFVSDLEKDKSDL